jgi:hypothetical protein
MNPVVDETGFITIGSFEPSLRAKRSNPGPLAPSPAALDCFVASLLAMTKEKGSGTP